MKSRLKKILTTLQKNKKYVLRIAAVAVSTSAFVAYRQITKKDKNLQAAYEKFPERIKYRSSHHSIQSLCAGSCDTQILDDTKKTLTPKSIESTTLLNATYLGAPRLTHASGSYSELNSLSTDNWMDFLNGLSDEVYITFAHRKGFSATNPVKFTHAILYISDKNENHALFGYTAHRGSHLINDCINTSVSRDYTLYSDLTICGDKKQAVALLKRIEDFSLESYTGFKFNCYSPLISGLLEAKSIGFHVPEFYNDSLLVVIPSEQNYGWGITFNQYLRPMSDSSIFQIRHKMLQAKDKALFKITETQDKVRNAFKP